MKSIIQKNNNECYMCGSEQWLEEHHIFEGSNRKISEKYGLKVKLCHFCHNEPPRGVHFNKTNMLILKKQGQLAFMEYYKKSKEEFIKIFGKSYI